jgi:signal transduction histidine kinase
MSAAACVPLLGISLLAAQPAILRDTVMVLDKPVEIVYRQAVNAQELAAIAQGTAADRFPLVVMRRQQLNQIIGMMDSTSMLAGKYSRLAAEQQMVDSMQAIRSSLLRSIVGIEAERARNYQELSEALKAENERLSALVTESLELAKDTRRGMLRRSWSFAIVGALVGITTGTLIGGLGK